MIYPAYHSFTAYISNGRKVEVRGHYIDSYCFEIATVEDDTTGADISKLIGSEKMLDLVAEGQDRFPEFLEASDEWKRELAELG